MYWQKEQLHLDQQLVYLNQVPSDQMLSEGLRAVENVELIIKDLDKRVKIFNREVVRQNRRRAHKTSEAYLTKLAKGLTWRLLPIGRVDLVESMTDEAVECGYDEMARDVELYKFYILKMMEKGYYPEDPMGSKPLIRIHYPSLET